MWSHRDSDLESKWTFVPHFQKIPQGVLKLCSREWDGQTDGWTDRRPNRRPLILTLSKQTRFICPQILILCGLMQKIPMRLRRRCAYTIPAVMAAGNAGGTVMVTMSRDSIMMVLAGTWGRQKGKSQEPLAVLIITCLWLMIWSSYKSALHWETQLNRTYLKVLLKFRFESQICGISVVQQSNSVSLLIFHFKNKSIART